LSTSRGLNVRAGHSISRIGAVWGNPPAELVAHEVLQRLKKENNGSAE
jgi:hypothetical protein